MNKNAEPVVVNFKKNTIAPYVVSKNKNIILIVSLIILAIVIIVVAIVEINKKVSEDTAMAVCTTQANLPVLMTAMSDIYQQNTGNLGNDIQNIETINNYQHDPNCLYPIVYYYINTSNEQQASIYLNKIKDVYSTKVGFNPVIGEVESLQSLESDVAFMKQNSATIKSNYTGITPPKNIKASN